MACNRKIKGAYFRRFLSINKHLNYSIYGFLSCFYIKYLNTKLYQNILFIMVDQPGFEPGYPTQSNLLSTRLVYSKSSLALSEQTNQKLTTLY